MTRLGICSLQKDTWSRFWAILKLSHLDFSCIWLHVRHVSFDDLLSHLTISPVNAVEFIFSVKEAFDGEIISFYLHRELIHRYHQIHNDKIQQCWYKVHRPDKVQGSIHSCLNTYLPSIHNHLDKRMNMSLGDLCTISSYLLSVPFESVESVPLWSTSQNLAYDNCLAGSNTTGIMEALETILK